MGGGVFVRPRDYFQRLEDARARARGAPRCTQHPPSPRRSPPRPSQIAVGRWDVKVARGLTFENSNCEIAGNPKMLLKIEFIERTERGGVRLLRPPFSRNDAAMSGKCTDGSCAFVPSSGTAGKPNPLNTTPSHSPKPLQTRIAHTTPPRYGGASLTIF